MADSVCFRVDEILSYRTGVLQAVEQIAGATGQIEAAVQQLLVDLLAQLKKVETQLREMDCDLEEARSVRAQDLRVLEQYRSKLEALRQEEDRLYRRAKELAQQRDEARQRATEIEFTPAWSNDPQIQFSLNQAKQVAYGDAVGSFTQLADAASEAKAALEKVRHQQKTLKHNIRVLQTYISRLDEIIAAIRSAMKNARAYSNQLKNAMEALCTGKARFGAASLQTQSSLSACAAGAEKAIEYGRSVCRLLDPDGDVGNHDSVQIAIADTAVLTNMATALRKSCTDYQERAELLCRKMRSHKESLADAVTEQGAAAVQEVLAACEEQMAACRDAAEQCSQAAAVLNSYLELVPQ